MWQWTETMTFVQVGHEPVELLEHRLVLVRHRVADGVGHVDRGRALVDRDLDHLGHELDVGARAVLGRELDVVGVLLRVGDGGAGLALHVLLGRLELALDVDVARGDEGVDARPLGVLDRVPGGVDVLNADVRARPQMTGPSTSRAIAWTASKSPGEVIGKPASMMSTPRRASWCAISTFSWRLSEMPGDCSPSRSVVSKIFTRLLSSLGHVVPFFALPRFSCARGFSGRHASFPPKGEKEKSQVEQERHAVLGYTPWPAGTR